MGYLKLIALGLVAALIGCGAPPSKPVISGQRSECNRHIVVPPSPDKAPPNPFGVTEVRNSLGSDVRQFAGRINLCSFPKDPNAIPWADSQNKDLQSIEGNWSGRWNGGNADSGWISGSAQVQMIEDWVYILYEDRTSKYLTVAKRIEADVLVGRYVNAKVASDTSPWVGVIVGNDRVNGYWSEGRWDYRR